MVEKINAVGMNVGVFVCRMQISKNYILISSLEETHQSLGKEEMKGKGSRVNMVILETWRGLA